MNIIIHEVTRQEFIRRACASKLGVSDADFAAKVVAVKAERHVTGKSATINRPQFGPVKMLTFRVVPALRRV